MLFCKGRSWLLFDRSLLQFVGSQKRGTDFVPKASGIICNLCTYIHFISSYLYRFLIVDSNLRLLMYILRFLYLSYVRRQLRLPRLAAWRTGGWLFFNSSMEWEKMASNWMPSSTPLASLHVLGPSTGNRQHDGQWRAKSGEGCVGFSNVSGRNMNEEHVVYIECQFP